MGLFPKFRETEEGKKALGIECETLASSPPVEQRPGKSPLFPSYENGWEKVFPVNGTPYWQKDNIRTPVGNWGTAIPQTPEEREKTQNILMGSIALYMEDHPEIEAGKDKPKT